MQKKTIFNWLCNILKDYPEKEISYICKNLIDDDISYKYTLQQFK